MTKLDQLVSGYLNREGLTDPTRTITLFAEVERLPDPFAPATVEYAEHVVQVWRPSWLRGIDWHGDGAPETWDAIRAPLWGQSVSSDTTR